MVCALKKSVYYVDVDISSFNCERNTDGVIIARFRLLRNNDTIYQIIGYTASEDDPDLSTAVTSCADVTQLEQKELYELNITIDTVTDVSDPECGVYIIESKKKYKIRIRSQSQSGIRSVSDAFYDFVCDRSSSLLSWITIPSFAQGSVPNFDIQPKYPDLSLWVMDYATNTPLSGTLELGKEVFYQIGFQPCYKQDTRFDTCGNEFLVAFHSFADTTDSVLTLYLINPSVITISVYVESKFDAIPCSPVTISPKSIGLCQINTTFTVTETSTKVIHVRSPYQCIYLQRQHSNSDYFSMIPIIPVDVSGQTYHLISSNHDTEILLVSNHTVVDLTPPNEAVINIEVMIDEVYYHSFTSGMDASGTTLVATNKVAVFKKTAYKNGSGTRTGYAFNQEIPNNSAGKQFFVPFFQNSKCLILKGSTTVKFGSTTSPLLNAGEILPINLVSNFKEVESSNPVICMAEITDYASLTLLPYEQWSYTYTFALTNDKVSHSLNIVIDSSKKDDLELVINQDITPITGAWVDVDGIPGSSFTMAGIEMDIDLSGKPSVLYATLNHPTSNFQAIIKSTHSTSNSISFAYLPGFNLFISNSDDPCIKTLGHMGDKMDNNCNGRADESVELLSGVSGSNYVDMKGIPSDTTCYDKLKVLDCDVSPDSTFDNPAQQRILENGCINGQTSDPFRPSSAFEYDMVHSDAHTKLYKSGKFPIVGFDGFENIYFRCSVKFCYRHDSSCETLCSQRRKRDTGTETGEPIEFITLADFTENQTYQVPCFDSSIFISGTTVLTLVLAILLTVIVYIWVKIYQLTSKRRSISQMSFHSTE